ncbi:MATE family efflux transporter [Clostridium ihumii]|uniref:MATE family efflux transporter n=1 Tax=Clostridium ihumii TaxID=1470356 RepID=UPI0005909DA0|nr:MATE family efflux transporter [Clostridium ihumii]
MRGNDKYLKFTKESIPKLIIQMAIPSTLAMFVGIAYSLVDTYFVSKISTDAMAAVGLAFSFISVIQALGLLFGHGSGNYISRMEGAKNRKESSKMAITGLIVSFFIGLVIMILGNAFVIDLVYFLGATKKLEFLTREYLQILLIGTPFMIASLTMNNQFRLQGNAGLGAIAIMLGAVSNCILDPIMIFGLDLGIKGAAYATIIGEIIGFLTLIIASRFKDSVRYNIKDFCVNKVIIRELFSGGIPNFLREIFIAFSLAILNNKLKAYGESYIASFTIVNRLILAGTYIMVGVGHGFQPICIFNYGANLYERVKKSLNFTLRFAVIFMVFIEVIFIVKSHGLIRIFRNDNSIINIGSKILKIQSFTLPLIGYTTISGMFLQGTHKFKEATIITTARQGFIYIPMIFILHYIFGLNGILYAQPVSDLITFIIAIVLVKRRNLELVKNQCLKV